ncbi:MAG: pyridoxal-phosphate dependent enzyme [Bacteroidota bacterium]
MPVDYSNIEIDNIYNEIIGQKNLSLSILRTDKIHPIISGNKLFKLHYFLDEALVSNHKMIITFGGAYSNHLAATAYACKLSKLRCIGIVRGEEPKQLSHTLQQCINEGMQLKFVSRDVYSQKDSSDFIEALKMEFGNAIFVPEGGYSPLGARGASLIMDLIPQNITHICCAVGTATTISGLLLNKKRHCRIIAIPVLKDMHDIKDRINFLTDAGVNFDSLDILSDYHFGGYAKKTEELIDFMNDLYNLHQLPTDFVYTAKMMYGIFDQIKNDHFPPGSNIMCIHTGGLQGNLSLPDGTLIF